MTCGTCQGVCWVCEAHPDRPWGSGHPNACKCGGTGMPCPACNEPKTTSARRCHRTSRRILIVTRDQCTNRRRKFQRAYTLRCASPRRIDVRHPVATCMASRYCDAAKGSPPSVPTELPEGPADAARSAGPVRVKCSRCLPIRFSGVLVGSSVTPIT